MTRGRPQRQYAYQGKQVTAVDLAIIAGCTDSTMRMRLQKMTPEEAVALGEAKKSKAPALHKYLGQMVRTAYLAKLAGCPSAAMRKRLVIHTPEHAVSMGAADKLRHKKPRTDRPPVVRVKKEQKPAAPRKPRRDNTPALNAQRAKLKGAWASKPVRAYDKLDPAAPVVCNVQPTIVPHGIDHRHTFTGTPGRWVDSSECRPWAAAVRG